MKKYFWGFGDGHFGDTFQWSLKVGDMFLDWLEKQDFGPKEDNECLFTGDLADKDTNAGSCIKQLTRLANIVSSKFKHVYIITGNHDKKIHRGIVQNAISFLSAWDNITVIEEPTKLTSSNGFKCLLLPYIRTDECTLSDYYNNLDESFTSEPVDIISGHWNKLDENIPYTDEGVYINKLPETKDYFIGHIHTRLDKDYTGSLWPCKVTEESTPYPRAIKCLCSDGTKKELEIPILLKFDSVIYPNKIEAVNDDLIHIYEVRNCNNLNLARTFYKDNYVRAIVKADNLKTENVIKSDENSVFLFSNTKDALLAMIKENDLTISRNLYSYISELSEIA